MARSLRVELKALPRRRPEDPAVVAPLHVPALRQGAVLKRGAGVTAIAGVGAPLQVLV